MKKTDVFTVARDGGSITLTCSSDVSVIDEALREINAFAEELAIADFSMVRLICRELLDNAIRHGNLEMEGKVVRCAVALKDGGRVEIVVEDEGDGFDHTALTSSEIEDPRNVPNRGYALIRSLAEDVRFELGGRRVTAVMKVDSEPGKELILERGPNGFVAVTPLGDVVGERVEVLREELLRQVEDGGVEFKFDFANVALIDSRGLGLLVALKNTIDGKADSTRIELTNVSGDSERLLRMFGLDKVFLMSA